MQNEVQYIHGWKIRQWSLRDTIQGTDKIFKDYENSAETYIQQLFKLKKNINSINEISNRMLLLEKQKWLMRTQKLLSKYEISKEK